MFIYKTENLLSSESDDESNPSKESSFIFKPIQTHLKWENESVHPFQNYPLLSFMQSDKYLFVFGRLLKQKYNDRLKDEWNDLKERCNPFIKEEWATLDSSINLDFDTHQSFVMEVVSPLFNEMVERKINLNSILSNPIVVNKIKKIIDGVFFISTNLSSFHFNTSTKLYEFNSTEAQTMSVLKDHLFHFEEEARRCLPHFSDVKNKQIITSILTQLCNVKSLRRLISDLTSPLPIQFNRIKPFELPYKNSILDLKTGGKRERTHTDYYTETLTSTYFTKYNSTPAVFKLIFGLERRGLKAIQMVLGSLFLNIELNYFILLTGGDESVYNLFHRILERLFSPLILSLNSISNNHNASLTGEDKRLCLLKDVKLNQMKSDSSFQFLITEMNVLGSTEDRITKSFITSVNKQLIEIPCKNKNEIPILEDREEMNRLIESERDFIFTWLIKGATFYRSQKHTLPFNIKQSIQFDSDDSFSSEDEIDLLNPFRVESNPVNMFLNKHIYRSIGKSISKKVLFNLFNQTNSNKPMSYNHFNAILIVMIKDDPSEDVWLDVGLIHDLPSD